MSLKVQKVSIEVDADRRVSGLLHVPAQARALYVLAHGAGVGMTHPSLAAIAEGLGARGVATLRYQFPYMEHGSKRPDRPPVACATVRAAAAKAQDLAPRLPLFAGGRSFGGRMISLAQAEAPLAGVRGLIFLAFPLHAAGRPSDERAEHLSDVGVPMLLLSGTRDSLATLDLLQPLIRRLGKRATLHLLPDADHGFRVPARSGRTDAEVREGLLDTAADWIAAVLAER